VADLYKDRCESCGLSREQVEKHHDRATDEGTRLCDELDSIYAHIRAVAENCKHSDVQAIRHQLVGLLPEVREIEPERAERMRESGLGNLVDLQTERVREAWASFGYRGAP
jgi:hypothetical protein